MADAAESNLKKRKRRSERFVGALVIGKGLVGKSVQISVIQTGNEMEERTQKGKSLGQVDGDCFQGAGQIRRTSMLRVRK